MGWGKHVFLLLLPLGCTSIAEEIIDSLEKLRANQRQVLTLGSSGGLKGGNTLGNFLSTVDQIWVVSLHLSTVEVSFDTPLLFFIDDNLQYYNLQFTINGFPKILHKNI